MKTKKITSFLFTFTMALLLLFTTVPTQAAKEKTQTPEQAYEQFLSEKIGQNKYFQIVNIGHKNAPVLIIGKGQKEVVNGKTCFRDCKVYAFSDGQIKKMKAFRDYGGRLISLKEKNGKYYLCNGGSDYSSLYTIKKGKVITHEYFNCHSAKGADRTDWSVFKKEGKIIKNLGYLKASKYEKRRDSYKTIESAINFIQNTAANRNSITK
ncbi:hypothetical protein BN3660_00807 [Eubacteriaceae bacterium CHKCI004]|nr:hypothetical protein BN3660_00807 [Eubacteriaceae bacterium CHKCI004]